MSESILRWWLGGATDTAVTMAGLRFGWPAWLLAAAFAAVVVVAAIYAWREGQRAGWRTGVLLFAMRTVLLVAIVWCLAEPRMLLNVVDPAPSTTAVLVDTSLSMTLAHDGTRSRAEVLRGWLEPADGLLAARDPAANSARQGSDAAAGRSRSAAGSGGADRDSRRDGSRDRTGSVRSARTGRPDVALFALGQGLTPVASADELRFDSVNVQLAAALERLDAQPWAAPPGAVVVVSDGNFALGRAERRALERLRGAGIPVHAIGVGPERAALDLAIAELRAPRRLVVGSVARVEVRVARTGVAARDADVRLELDGRVMAERRVALDTESTTVAFSVPVAEGGMHRAAASVTPLDGESNTLNNRDSLLLRAEDRQVRVLHVEGEPRFEVKFLRRALAGDPNLALVSLVRTAENKFYRLGVADASELRDGFPADAETLFRYDVLIVGSVPVSMLSAEQQQLIQAFAAQRGGGVLFLGGRFAFAEGGLRGGPLAAMLPVHLSTGATARNDMLAVGPTAAGARHGIAGLILGGPRVMAAQALPPLTSVNASVGDARRAKPGAAVLWEGQPEYDAPPRIVLAEQRYGRGHTAVLAVRDTWRWQLHGDIPLDDQTHETFWRQWLRWLARDAGPPVRIDSATRRVAPGEDIELELQAYGPRYGTGRQGPPADAPAVVAITPAGERISLVPEASPAAGIWRARFRPEEAGVHEFELSAAAGDAVQAPPHAEPEPALGTQTDRLFVDVQALGREPFAAARNDRTLERIAAWGGGRYVTADNAASLVAGLAAPVQNRVRIRTVELWNLPWLYGLMLMVMLGEWMLRRWRALP